MQPPCPVRALVWPPRSYVSDAITAHLTASGGEVLSWQSGPDNKEGGGDGLCRSLAGATAVFHELHGHEQHALDTVMRLLKTATTVSPVVFVGISTPLTWATTLTASMQPPLSTDVDVEPSGAPPSPSSPSPPVPLAVLTEQDAPTRQPAPSALATYHLEQQLLRMAQRPALSVRILCPGVLYGNGEDDGALHGLLRAAWEGTLPLQLPSYTQTYRLPTLHVRDMAAIAVSIAVEPPPPDRQYLLAVDSLQLTLGGLLGALESALGCAGARFVDPSEALHALPNPMLQLDLPLVPSALPQSPELHCPKGLLAHLQTVLSELYSVRGLAPLRLLVRGPPASGKTHLASRLAQMYGLLHVTPHAVLAELQYVDATTQQAAAAQLASKEGRLSQALMARLAQHLLSRLPAAAKQGWVLDGWPRTLAGARAFTTPEMAAPSITDREAAAGIMRRSTAPTKEARRRLGPAAADAGFVAAAGGVGRRPSMEEDEAAIERNADAQVSAAALLIPHCVIELDAPEEELLRRVRALAAIETRTASSEGAGGGVRTSPRSKRAGGAVRREAGPALLTAGALSSSGGGGVSPGAAGASPSSSHNTERDLLRRLEAWRGTLQEDATDATARRAIAAALERPATPGSRAAAVDRQHASSSRAGAGQSNGGGKAPTGLPLGVALPPPAPPARESADGHMTARAAQQDLAGWAAHFVDAGSMHVRLRNEVDPSLLASALTPAPQARLSVAAELPATAALLASAANPTDAMTNTAVLAPLSGPEERLVQLLGRPRNYCGFQHNHGQQHQVASILPSKNECGMAAASATEQIADLLCSTCTGTSGCTQSVKHLRLHAGEQKQLSVNAATLAGSLLHGVLPCVMAGLVKLALERPPDPCAVLAHELLVAADALEAGYCDPYADPAYGVQLAKVQAKAGREAARAAAAAAKAAREQAGRAAAAEQAASEAAAAAAMMAATAAASQPAPSPQPSTARPSSAAPTKAAGTRPSARQSVVSAKAGARAGAVART